MACADIANLFLARLASRASEFTTRIALGAGRMRILTQMLAETTLLALFGGAVGAIIAGYGAGFLAAYGPDDVRLLADTRLSLPVFLFAMAASLVTGIACGAFPVWQIYLRDAAVEFQKNARTVMADGGETRSRQYLVGVQMALGTALLASAGLLLHSFIKLMGADRGYQVEHVLAVDLSLFGASQDPAAFYRQLAENTRTLPGVIAVGAINDLPVASGASGASRTIFYATDTDFQSVVPTEAGGNDPKCNGRVLCRKRHRPRGRPNLYR
jgi:hypothetical protein